jgi:hypothetical protein
MAGFGVGKTDKEGNILRQALVILRLNIDNQYIALIFTRTNQGAE